MTTRTTTLISVPHASFALRFSELPEIEAATREDDEQRAGRTMDWIGARVATRAARWVELVEAAKDDKDSPWRTRTPWWEEVKRCVEGDHVPSKTEGWNHPVASACDFTSWVSDVCHQDAERLIMVISFLPCG